MQQNGFFARVDALLADPAFRDDAAVRDAKLEELRNDMLRAPIDGKLPGPAAAKLESDYPGQTMRFRTSTNAEDLDGFLCAGCYDSHTGDPANWEGSLLSAIRRTWATVWNFRTFEERAVPQHRPQRRSRMALLVHHNFPDEEANGVAITANPFDASGLQPGFYINVQQGGEAEVVAPAAWRDQRRVHPGLGLPGPADHDHLPLQHHPARHHACSTPTQVNELGKALDVIHKRFSPAYGPASGNTGFYGLEVDFKFDSEAVRPKPRLFVKQARPYRGRGGDF